MSKRVSALTRYGSLAASTRQRFQQYEPYLEAQEMGLSIEPLVGDNYLKQRFMSNRISLGGVPLAYGRRAVRCLAPGSVAAVWLHCETFPYLPPVFERLPFLRGLPVVFDLDDAIFHKYDQHSSRFVRRLLGSKLVPLLEKSNAVFAGNAYLADWARLHSRNVNIVPTVVDTDIYKPQVTSDAVENKSAIGWIGSPSTYPYVRKISNVLAEVAQASGATVTIVGAESAASNVPFTFKNWRHEAEVSDIQAMDIGIMPLEDTAWARGKCGYKLIQYMACGLPVVASPVGVNSEIVEHGVNGFLARTDEEWRSALTTLLNDSDLRRRMGKAGRRKIEAEYSLQVWGPKVADLLRSVVEYRNA